MIIVPGPSSRELGYKIAQLLNEKIISVEQKTFPDGESYIRFTEEVKGEEVIIVQTTGPPQDTNLIQLLFMLRTLKELGAQKVTAIVPYFAYARQDERYRPGEIVSAKIIIDLLEKAGADEFITFDIHNLKLLEHFKIKAINLTAMPLIGEFFSKFKLREPFVLAPDQENPKRAEIVAKILGCDYSWLDKFRDRVTGEIKSEIHEDFDVMDKDVVIVDDIISTGKTIVNAIKILKDKGAKDMYVGCTHPVLAQGALERITRAGAKVIAATDSINSSISKISLAPLVASYIRKAI
ncbi:MAG: ribose-phosphate diphosphokinase [Candidatus Hadarchaeales archaeon]